MSRRTTSRNSERFRPDPRPNETSDDGAAAARACQTAERIHLRQQYREAFEEMHQEQEAMRQAAEEAGGMAEAMRVASMATMAATARSLSKNIAPMPHRRFRAPAREAQLQASRLRTH